MKRKLKWLVPSVRRKAEELQAACAKRGIKIVFTSTLRTDDEQKALWAQSRESLETVNELRRAAGLWEITTEANKKVVTWRRRTFHMYGVAFDFAIVRNGKASWDVKADINDNDIPDYEEVGRIAESLGLESGARFKDYCHCQSKGPFTVEDLEFIKSLRELERQ